MFFADHTALADPRAFAAFLAPLRKAEWVVYAKKPSGGPHAVLAYLSRYTHRVAISNRRLISADDTGVSFTWKNRRACSLQDHGAGDPRVHPPVPDPRLAHGLSSHPPLRSAGERREGRQPRARPQAARPRSASARARACRVRSDYAHYAVPVLRLGHAHHRGVQGREGGASIHSPKSRRCSRRSRPARSSGPER
jgi:Putative transposase